MDKDKDNADDITLLTNAPTQAESLRLAYFGEGNSSHCPPPERKQKVYVSKREETISTLNGGPLKLVDKIKYLGSSV